MRCAAGGTDPLFLHAAIIIVHVGDGGGKDIVFPLGGPDQAAFFVHIIISGAGKCVNSPAAVSLCPLHA